MRIAMLPIACMWLLSCSAPVQVANGTKIPDSAFESLSKLNEVGGSAVGYGGGPGEFYKLMDTFLAKGTAADFAALIQHPSSIFRAMGLVCLTRSDRKAARNQLMSRLEDDGTFLCFPGGCVGETMTVGRFAWALLHDASYLTMGDADKWLTDEELLALDIDVLSKDKCFSFHSVARYRAALEIDQEYNWRYETNISALVRRLPVFDAIKGLGRISSTATTRRVLSLALLNDQLPNNVRLAAASGLTRDPSLMASAFLRDQDRLLRSIAPALHDHLLLEVQNSRAEIVGRLEEASLASKQFLDHDCTDSVESAPWERREQDTYIVAHFVENPIAVDELTDALGTTYLEDDTKLAARFGQCLSHMATRLPEVCHCWSTDSDCILRFARLRSWLNDPKKYGLEKKDFDTIDACIKAAQDQLATDCEKRESTKLQYP